MHGGVILFRGVAAAARRYLEADRSGADEYYLEAGCPRGSEPCTVDEAPADDQAGAVGRVVLGPGQQAPSQMQPPHSGHWSGP